MATERSAPGASIANRLAARAEIQRKSMPGGGDVVSGELASRALRAVGARAMTLDRTVIVDEGFDTSKKEDQALFAHEQHHVEHGDGGGGGGGQNFRDAEEVAARASEAMVFHRMSGGYEGGDSQGAGGGTAAPGQPASQGGGGVGAGTQSSSEKSAAVDRAPNAGRGYQSMTRQGYSHQDIVDELARKAMGALEERNQSKLDRAGDKRGTFSGSGTG